MIPLTKFLLRRAPRWLGCCAVGACLLVFRALGAEPATDPKAPAKTALSTAFEFPKFAFVDDIKVGKDPFYPKSARRMPPKPPVNTNITEVVTVPGEPLRPPVAKPKASSFLTLKGMLGSKAKRLVLISTATDSYEFIGTKSQMVETPEGRVRVQCVEFKRESVVISVEGEADPVELKLADN